MQEMELMIEKLSEETEAGCQAEPCNEGPLLPIAWHLSRSRCHTSGKGTEQRGGPPPAPGLEQRLWGLQNKGQLNVQCAGGSGLCSLRNGMFPETVLGLWLSDTHQRGAVGGGGGAGQGGWSTGQAELLQGVILTSALSAACKRGTGEPKEVPQRRKQTQGASGSHGVPGRPFSSFCQPLLYI